MKKIVSAGPCKTEFMEVEEPRITKPTDVKIRMSYCGVCMSEHYDWSIGKEGRVFGHEPVGIVTEVGAEVSGIKVGDRVSGLFSGAAEYVIAKQENVFVLPDNV